MAWVMLLTAVAVASVVAGLKIYYSGPPVDAERIAPQDLDLVRGEECAAWRKVSRRTYQGWKQQDDFYRVAAYKKAIESGMSAADAKAYVKKDFPFYYVDPALRDEDTYVGDDGGLPIVLRERVNKWAPLLKPVMVEKSAQFRTMNALVREFIRKGAM
jgi:hypothetical protein